MYTLALETSTETGSVALLKDSKVIDLREWRREKSHSELVTTKIIECLSLGKVEVKNLDRIAVGVGPGSFTGIRIAINAAKTLSYSSGAKIFSANTFRILAEPTRLQPLPVLVLMNAHKNLIYVASLKFESNGSDPVFVIAPNALTAPEIEQQIKSPHLCLGDGFELWKDVFSENFKNLLVRDPIFSDEPSAAHLGRIACSSREDQLRTWDHLQPLYIRASEPEEKLKAGLFKDRSRINE